MKPCHFFVEDLGKLVNAALILLGVNVVPEFELGKSLVGERGRHDDFLKQSCFADRHRI